MTSLDEIYKHSWKSLLASLKNKAGHVNNRSYHCTSQVADTNIFTVWLTQTQMALKQFVKTIEYSQTVLQTIALVHYTDGVKEVIFGGQRMFRVRCGYQDWWRSSTCKHPSWAVIHNGFNQVKVLNYPCRWRFCSSFWVKKVNTYLFVFNRVKFIMVAGTCRATIGTVGSEQQSYQPW